MTKLGILVVVMGSTTAAFADEAERAKAIQQAKDAGILATHVSGDKAMTLARAVKFAGVKPATAKNVRTFKVAAMHCWTSKEGTDEQLGDYKCSLDKLEIKDGLAFLLLSAMEGAGMQADDHMSQHTVDAKSVTCEIDPAKTGDARFECFFGKK
jgi:hypothetical protein